MAGADELEPVIVSSNRYADIEPYTKKLLVEDPKLWGQVLPWEFPQQTTQTKDQIKREEEAFLREFFTEREIRMQGGADGNGNGFRFLKQVWYCAALWNVYERLPALVNWWFKHNQDLLNDDSMKEHFFKPDVQPSTFFQAAEIEMYGEKLLGWAIKQIQFRLRPESMENTQSTPTTLALQDSATAVPSSAVAGPDTKTEENPVKKPNGASGKLAPTAKPYQALSSPMVAPPTQQTRSISGDTNPYSGQELSTRKQRGPHNGKRSSFNASRPNPRPFQDSSDSRYMSGPVSRFGGPANAPVNQTPATFGQNRVPSGGPPAVHPRNAMPPLPQGQPAPFPSAVSPHPFAAAPPPMYEPGTMQLPSPSGGAPNSYGAYQPGSLQHGQAAGPGSAGFSTNVYNMHQQQPFLDRSNFPSDHAFNKQTFYPNGSNVDPRQKQRRESVTSRGGPGGKGRGYASLRGRGSRGRNSFSQSSGAYPPFDSQSADRDAWYMHNGPDAPPSARRFSTQRDRDLQGQNWRAQNENSAPRQFPATQDARFNGAPIPHRGYMPGEFSNTAAVPPHRGSNTSFNPFHNTHNPRFLPLCVAGCTRETISNDCDVATKLVVFGSPGQSGQEVKQDLGALGVGGISHASKPKENHPGRPTQSYVTFENVDMARHCLHLVRKGIHWPNNRRVTAEIASEHWDPGHFSHFSHDQQHAPHPLPAPVVATLTPMATVLGLNANPANPTFVPEPPTKEDTSKVGDQGIEDQTKEPVSETTTPTASGPSTPKKKKKSNNGKKKRAQKSVEMDDTFKGENADLAVERKDSIWVDHDSNTEGGTKGLVAQSCGISPAVSKHNNEAEVSQTPVEATSSTEHGDSDSLPGGDDSNRVGSPITQATQATAEDATQDGPEIDVLSKQEKVEPQHDAKSHDDHIDDSFHTAGDSPAQEQEHTPGNVEVSNINSLEAATAEMENQPSGVSSDNGESPKLAISPSEELVPETSEPKASKKAPIPRIPKSRNVSIVLPPVAIKAVADVDEVEDAEVQSAAERKVSNGSDDAPSAFVTAPNTPALPEASPEQQSKKAVKPKGPVQTESLSIFGKKKSKKPKKKGSVRGRQNMEQLDNPTGSNLGDGAEVTEDSASPVAAKSAVQDLLQDRETGSTEPTLAATSINIDESQTAGRTASRRGTGILATLGGFLNRNGGQTVVTRDDATTKPSATRTNPAQVSNAILGIDTSAVTTAAHEERVDSAVEGQAKANIDVGQETHDDGEPEALQDATGLGISTESPPSKTKKSKKKKSKKSKSASASVAESQGSDQQGDNANQDSPVSVPSQEFQAGKKTTTLSPPRLGTSPASSSKQVGLRRKVSGKMASDVSRDSEEANAAASDVSGNGPLVTWIILTQPDNHQQQETTPPQKAKITEVVEDEERLSPEVVAAKERLENLKMEEKAAKEKNKAVDQTKGSDE